MKQQNSPVHISKQALINEEDVSEVVDKVKGAYGKVKKKSVEKLGKKTTDKIEKVGKQAISAAGESARSALISKAGELGGKWVNRLLSKA
tara:strand:- start:236 stop:505 length:270 start_codon:yes stop_codon:yes gene_type:complete